MHRWRFFKHILHGDKIIVSDCQWNNETRKIALYLKLFDVEFRNKRWHVKVFELRVLKYDFYLLLQVMSETSIILVFGCWLDLERLKWKHGKFWRFPFGLASQLTICFHAVLLMCITFLVRVVSHWCITLFRFQEILLS